MNKVLRFFLEFKELFKKRPMFLALLRNRLEMVMTVFEPITKNWQKTKFIFFCVIFALFSLISFITFKLQSTRLTTESISDGQMALIDLETDSVMAGYTLINKEQKEEAARTRAELDKQVEDKMMNVDTTKVNYRFNSIAEADADKPKIAIILTDLGLSKSMTLMALEQDHIFTLGFSPYANNIGEWIDQSYKKGFETYIQIPMQPVDYPINDPGPYALLQNLSIGENLTRLDWVMTRSDKIAGFYTPQNDAFSTSRSNSLPLLEKLKEKEKILLYGNSANEDSLQSLSESLKLEYLPVNYIIDEKLTEKAIIDKLNLLLAHALSKGSAVGYLSPYPLSIKTVKKWLEKADKSSFVIVPASTIINHTILATEQPVSGNTDAKN